LSNSELYYFEEELSYLREKSATFAKNHPEVANALGLSKDSIDDPQIARLIESVSLLNARIQKRLDDNYSDFTESILNVTYPDFLKTIPSYSIIEVDVDNNAKAKGFIPKGTMFELKDQNIGNCYFKSTDDLVIYPLILNKVSTYVAPFNEENIIGSTQAKNLIEFEFNTTEEGINCKDLSIENLDIAIRSENNLSFKIYDEICQNIVDIYLEINGKMISLSKDVLTNNTFELDKPLLPYSSNSYPGLNLLNEFFLFRGVFNKININLEKVKYLLDSNTFKIKLFLKEMKVDVFRSLQKDNFVLHHVPVINLYETYAEPIIADGLKENYPIVVYDNNRELSLYKVVSVESSYDSVKEKIPELYNEDYYSQSSSKRWSVRYNERDGLIKGNLQLIDLNHNNALKGEQTLLIKVLVTDGFIPSKINYTNVEISAMSAITVPGKLKLMRRPTMQFNPRNDKTTNWEVLAHMSFNYQAVLGRDDSIEQLKSIFRLYNIKESRRVQTFIDALKRIESTQIVEPIRINGKSCYVNGLKIAVILNAQEIKDGLLIFAQFLEKYFGAFVNYNSFIQVDIYLEGNDEVYVSFPRRLGCR
jgi:type VI secretion system protein ImpG